MRIFQIFLIISLLLIIPLGSTEASTAKKTRVDAKLNSVAYETTYFTINLPKGWLDESDILDEPIFVSPNLGATISASATELEDSIEYDPKLRKFWLGIFLEEYKEFEDFKFISSKTVSIDGVSGIRIDFKATFDGTPMEMYQMITIKNGIQYVLTAAVTDKNQWKKHKSILTKSFATLKINP